jgi:hypothetical protein
MVTKNKLKANLIIALVAVSAAAMSGRAYALVAAGTATIEAVQTVEQTAQALVTLAQDASQTAKVAALLGMDATVLNLKLAKTDKATFAKQLADDLRSGKVNLADAKTLVGSASSITNRTTTFTSKAATARAASQFLIVDLLNQAGKADVATRVLNTLTNLQRANQLEAAIGVGSLVGVTPDHGFCLAQAEGSQVQNAAAIFEVLADASPETLSALSAAEIGYLEQLEIARLGLGADIDTPVNVTQLLSASGQCRVLGSGASSPASGCSSTACMRLAATIGG